MKLFYGILLASSLFVSCNSAFVKYHDNLESRDLVGQPYTEALQRWGSPIRNHKNKMDQDVYTFRVSRVEESKQSEWIDMTEHPDEHGESKNRYATGLPRNSPTPMRVYSSHQTCEVDVIVNKTLTIVQVDDSRAIACY